MTTSALYDARQTTQPLNPPWLFAIAASDRINTTADGVGRRLIQPNHIHPVNPRLLLFIRPLILSSARSSRVSEIDSLGALE